MTLADDIISELRDLPQRGRVHCNRIAFAYGYRRPKRCSVITATELRFDSPDDGSATRANHIVGEGRQSRAKSPA